MQDSNSECSADEGIQDASCQVGYAGAASSVRMDRNGKKKALALALYLCVFASFLFLLSRYFSYVPFISIGPIWVIPEDDLALPFQCLVIFLAGIVGVYYLLRRSHQWLFVDAFFAAAVSSDAAVGMYLLCYALYNIQFRTAFVLLLAAIVVFAIVSFCISMRNGGTWSLFGSLVGPLWALLCCAGFVISLFPGWALTVGSYPLQMPEQPEQRTLAANMDTAEKFYTEEWRSASVEEKAADLGTIVVVESDYYGVNLPTEITVSALPGFEAGSYDHRENKITLNTSYLAVGVGTFWVQSVTHEMVHAFQWQACTGQITADNASEWYPDEDTLEQWRYEMNDYVTYFVDAEGYYSQAIEKTAFSRGWNVDRKIRARVDKYHETGNPEP